MTLQSGHEHALAEEAALRWRARLMSGDASPAERLEFQRWLAAAPENADSFRRLEAALSGLDAHGAEILAREFERELAALSGRPPMRRRWVAAAVAAAVAALALPAVHFFNPAPAAEVFATRVGERRTVELADGSRVTLNTSTRMTAELRRGRRDVRLEQGEALFTVAHDSGRPFTVTTGRAVVVVTGTVFNVRAGKDASSVYVVSGSVAVSALPGADATLIAGDAIHVSASGASRIERFDAGAVLAWREGRLKFAETRLGEAVAELNRYFATPIALDEAGLADLPLTGEVPTDDQNAAVAAVAMAFDLEVRRESGRIVLAGKQE